MNEPYTPANGSEGADFFDTWCRRCQRDKAMREGADFDECDEFVEAGNVVPEVDTLTGDLFA